MRAIAVDDYGAAPSLHELPTPTPGPGEVLVHIAASSVNGFDLAVASGMIKGLMEHRFPLVLGRDFVGTVEARGEGVTRFDLGDTVFGMVLKAYLHDGAFGEYVAVPEGFGIAKVPNGLSLPQAGALALAGVAAQMSVEAVAPSAGETVLISGATGGVGACAIQLVTARGATVIATAKPGMETDFVRQLGAANTIDYTGDVVAGVRAQFPNGVDAVIHLAGDGIALTDTLVPNGRIASTLLINPEMFADRPVKATGIIANPEPTRLEYLASEAAAGRLRISIERSYTLEQVPQAFADFAAGTLGKLAITLD